MRNLTYTEKKMLIVKHLREGYSYSQAIEMIKANCQCIKEITSNNRKKKIKKEDSGFEEEFNLLIKS